MKSDRILGAVCVVTAIAMGWAAKDYAAPISYEPVGPRAFPLLMVSLMGLMGLLGGWLVIKPSEHKAGLSLQDVRALPITDGNVSILCENPISKTLWLLAIVLVTAPSLLRWRRKRSSASVSLQGASA